MTNRLEPYRVHGGVLGTFDPVLLSISGGRTSGMMLHRILEAYDGVLPPQIHPVFTNTGREFDQALDFVEEMGRRWSVHITWIERDFVALEGFRVVSHNSAARHGMRTPFDDVIELRGFLPNGVMRFCTGELKVKAASHWMKAQGYERWCSVLGYRADEMRRLNAAQHRDATGKDPWYTLAPHVDAGVTKRDVAAFWAAQPFDLRLPNVNGKTPLGNCDLCFLKGEATLAGIARDYPDRAAVWVGDEAMLRGKTKGDADTYRNPKKGRTHTQLVDFVRRQGDMVARLSDEDNGADCFCVGG